MAPWQFRTKVIPSGVLPDRTDQADRGGEAAQRFWINYSSADEIVKAFSHLLPEDSSWSSSAKMFGESKGDRIEIWYEDGKLAWISISFSLSHPNAEFVKRAVWAVSALKCQFFDIQSKSVFDPNLSSFTEHARRCSAARYLPTTIDLSKLIE